jgi:hypothetical protein
MRLVPGLVSLVVSIVAFGCGAGSETSGSGTPAASTATEQVDTSTRADRQKPPPIVLVSDAGSQTAVPGSFCVQYTDEAAGESGGACADTPAITPAQMTTVRPGEVVRVVLEDAEITRSGSLAVHPLCRRKTVESIPLDPGPETTWRVDLEPGRYQLDVFAYFESADGRSGDVSGSLGVLVDDAAPLEIVPVPALPRCA